MKQNKTLKSLNELSPELLAPEVAQTVGSTPGTSELVTAETQIDPKSPADPLSRGR